MSQHRSYPDLRRRNAARNYFGEGTDGDVVISADTSLAATQDGDMVVKHYKSLTINAGKTLTTAARCRGLLVYVQGDCIINGTLSMSARGAHANPADAAVTSNTPVAPGDGHAVPADGITIRRLVKGYSLTDEDDDLMWGCGAAAVAAEAHQPKVSGNGLVIAIPRVGGAGGLGQINDGDPGGTLALAPGGGGGGGGYGTGTQTGGDGTAGTCFSGGSAGGGCGYTYAGTGTDAEPYGGAGGDGYDNAAQGSGGGAGNPGGIGGKNSLADAPEYSADDGTGGLLVLIVGGDLSGDGVIEANGSDGGPGLDNPSLNTACGGGSGGGCVIILYAGENLFAGSITANGGDGHLITDSGVNQMGGDGGAGAVIGPYKIDPA